MVSTIRPKKLCTSCNQVSSSLSSPKQHDILKISHVPVQWRLWKTGRHSNSKLCPGFVSRPGLASSWVGAKIAHSLCRRACTVHESAPIKEDTCDQKHGMSSVSRAFLSVPRVHLEVATSACLKHTSEREHACAVSHKRMFETLSNLELCLCIRHKRMSIWFRPLTKGVHKQTRCQR